MMDEAITVENLAKRFENVEVVSGITFYSSDLKFLFIFFLILFSKIFSPLN